MIKNLTSLTVGGGSALGAVDIPLNPFVLPASSVKGAMRTAVNNYLPDGFTSCGEIEPERIKEKHKGTPCDVCRLFGYPDQKEHSCFTLSVVVPDVKPFRLTRVSIDDRTQRAKEGALFTQEALPAGTEFEVRVSFRDSCGERMLKLLLYSIWALRLWRVGRNAMVDVKLKGDICQRVKCDDEMRALVDSLKEYVWGE